MALDSADCGILDWLAAVSVFQFLLSFFGVIKTRFGHGVEAAVNEARDVVPIEVSEKAPRCPSAGYWTRDGLDYVEAITLGAGFFVGVLTFGSQFVDWDDNFNSMHEKMIYVQKGILMNEGNYKPDLDVSAAYWTCTSPKPP